MRWLQSFGGPLILLPRDSVHLWAGSFGPDGSDEIDEEDTDYWRISEAIQDYADTVDVRGVEALVLANGRCPTTFVQAENLFVQEMSTGARYGALETTSRALDAVVWAHFSSWRCSGPSVLFDAARFGPSVQESELLAIDIDPGNYSVSSAYWIPGSDAESSVALTRLEYRR
jgi:hypothetical protein